MTQKPISRRFLTPMVAIALVLTVALAVVVVAARVVTALGDASGGRMLDWVALVLGVIWVIDAVCLVLALGVNALEPSLPRDEPDELE